MGPQRTGTTRLALSLCLGAISTLPTLAKDRTLAVTYNNASYVGYARRAPDGGTLRLQKKVLVVWITRQTEQLARGKAVFSFKSANWKNFRVQLATRTWDNRFALRRNGIAELSRAFHHNVDVPEASKKTESASMTLPSDERSDAFFAGQAMRTELVLHVRDRNVDGATLRADPVRMVIDERDATPDRIAFAVATSILSGPGAQVIDPGAQALTPTTLVNRLHPSAPPTGNPWRAGAVGFYARGLAPSAAGRNPERYLPPTATREAGARHPANVAALLSDLFDGKANEAGDAIELRGLVARGLDAMEFRLRALPTITWRQLVLDVGKFGPEDVAAVDAVLRLNFIDPESRVLP